MIKKCECCKKVIGTPYIDGNVELCTWCYYRLQIQKSNRGISNIGCDSFLEDFDHEGLHVLNGGTFFFRFLDQEIEIPSSDIGV